MIINGGNSKVNKGNRIWYIDWGNLLYRTGNTGI